MKKVNINVIDHKDQRYPTVGDWQIDENGLTISISDTGDFYSNMAIALHEFAEAVLCMKANITELSVDMFDIAFENKRPEGNTDEPGDDPSAPYHKQHVFATSIEKQFIAELGIDWNNYEKTVNSL